MELSKRWWRTQHTLRDCQFRRVPCRCRGAQRWISSALFLMRFATAVVTPVRAPASTSDCTIQSRSVCATQPIFGAIDLTPPIARETPRGAPAPSGQFTQEPQARSSMMSSCRRLFKSWRLRKIRCGSSMRSNSRRSETSASLVFARSGSGGRTRSTHGRASQGRRIDGGSSRLRIQLLRRW